MGQFGKELLRDRDLVIGRFDSRYTGYVRDRLALQTPYDPSGEAVMSAFASTFNQYVRADLKFEMDRPYEVLSHGIGSWNWNHENSYVNVTDSLSETLTRNPFLRIHVSSGYYDLATPYFATRYTFDHLQINPSLLRNISFDYYAAGHMMYLNLADLRKQQADLARFIRLAAAPPR
jgi:carboxypeptidase C (cathepsin A)